MVLNKVKNNKGDAKKQKNTRSKSYILHPITLRDLNEVEISSTLCFRYVTVHKNVLNVKNSYTESALQTFPAFYRKFVSHGRISFATTYYYNFCSKTSTNHISTDGQCCLLDTTAIH